MTLPFFAAQSKLLTEVSKYFNFKIGQKAIYHCYQYKIPVLVSGYLIASTGEQIKLRYQVTTLKSIELEDTFPGINQLDIYEVDERELENLPIYVTQ